jgi:hypothetical protein
LTQRSGGFDPRRDYYKRLGVPPGATQQAIQQAFRERAKKLHPDLNPERREWATEQFQHLNEAYKILSDPLVRRQYDERRSAMFGSRQRSRRTQSDINWWDVPNQPQPGYGGVRSRRRPAGPATDYRPGAWMQKIGLGLLRPFYIAIFDLATSPYRWLLGLLGLVLLGNLAFIVMNLPFDDDPQSQSALPTAIETNIAEGQVATSAPPTATTLPLAIDITVCEPELMLAIESIKILAQSDMLKVSARVRTPNLRVHTDSVRLIPVELLSETQARPLDGGRAAELEVTVDVDASTQTDAIAAPDLPAGNYLLSWTPLAPDGHVLGFCQQVLTISNS